MLRSVDSADNKFSASRVNFITVDLSCAISFIMIVVIVIAASLKWSRNSLHCVKEYHEKMLVRYDDTGFAY